MKPLLTLAFVSLLCTCVRAQNRIDKLPRDLVNVAFVKGATGRLIDSLTVRTTLDTVPYGFAFPNKSLFLDVSIFDPADELTLETFSRGSSFGRARCWVDGPTADVHLSVRSGRNVIDSVSLSFVDRMYREEFAKTRALESHNEIKKSLGSSAYNYYDLLFAADFLIAYADLPNLRRWDVERLAFTLRSEVSRVIRHPRFDEVRKKGRLMGGILPGNLRKYDLWNANGEPVRLNTPKNKNYVLNFYSSTQPDCTREHQLIASSLATDTLFDGVELISISGERKIAAWQHYAQEGNFKWQHYHEDVSAKRKLTEKLAFYPACTYVLINDHNLIEGIYDNVLKLAAALDWRQKENSIQQDSKKIILEYQEKFNQN